MLCHVIRRHSHANLNPTNKSPSNYKSELILKLMSRYHYSRNAPNSATSRSDSSSFIPRQYSITPLSKPTTVTTTTTSNNNNNNQSSPGPFRSTYIPLVRNSRPMTSDKREFISIPIKREDGTPTPNNAMRSIPITFVNETTSLLSNNDNNSRDTSPPRYASKYEINELIRPKNLLLTLKDGKSLLRPSPKYFQHHSNNNRNEEPAGNPPHLPSLSRRLSLTVPVMTTKTATADDDETVKQTVSSTSSRPIPIRLSQPSNVASIPTNSSRLSSAILRSSPPSNPSITQLQRQRSDLGNTLSSSSDFTSMPINGSPVRRSDVMAREAIQGIVRFQQQQQQQQQQRQRNGSTSDSIADTLVGSPLLSRRVIVNLKNNQSVSLDSRISSASSPPTRPPTTPPSSRVTQRNNLYHIPVLHEIQVPPHPATIAAESFQFPRSPMSSERNSYNYKNEFRMEIPVTLITNNDQENFIEEDTERSDEIFDYDQHMTIVSDRIPSASSHQALKSILKRSASRENVLRKNVSFMNA